MMEAHEIFAPTPVTMPRKRVAIDELSYGYESDEAAGALLRFKTQKEIELEKAVVRMAIFIVVTLPIALWGCSKYDQLHPPAGMHYAP